MQAPFQLSKRQLHILSLIAAGYSTKEMARYLHRSTRTIDTHRRDICRLMHVPNTHAALTVAVQTRLIDPEAISVKRIERCN